MPEEQVVKQEPSPPPNIVDPTVSEGQETPPAVPAPDPLDALDERGVPIRNRLSELERKLNEQIELNRQYQIALGQQVQQRQTPPAPTDDIVSKYGPDERKFVRAVAEEVGYELLTKLQVSTALQEDKELADETQRQYQTLLQNPLWASASEVLRQQQAVTAAQATINKRRLDAARTTQTQQVVRQAVNDTKATATLPRTSPPSDSSAGLDEKEKFIRDFLAEPRNHKMLRMLHRLNPDSKEGQEKLREAAEYAWEGTAWGGAVGVAARELAKFQGVKV